MATNSNTRPAAARAFVRSLNILLKFARMYDFGHPRTAKQYETAWQELRTALGTGTENEAGVLLGVSGDQLLLDGTPLESAAAERSFARMLSAAGIASIHFAPQVTQASLARFVRGFPTGTGAKPVQLAEQLKSALQGDPHIHVNEVCFVPADSAVARSTVAQQLAAHTLGLNSQASDELFADPERLLQLIVAAEGTKGGGSRGSGKGGYSDGDGDGEGNGSGNGSGDGSGGVGSGYGVGGSGSGHGYGQGPGSGYGPGGGYGPGNAGPGSGSGERGPGGGFHYAPEAAEITRDLPSVGGAPEGGSPIYVAGATEAGQASNSGSTEGGNPAGGAGSSTWNIVGSAGSGTPLAPDTPGFWLNKDAAGDAASGGSRQASGSALNDISAVQGPGGSRGTGAGPGSGGGPGAGPGTGSRRGSGDRSGRGPGNGRGNGPGSGKGSGPAGGGSSSPRGWNLADAVSESAEVGKPSRWGNATAGIRGSRSARGGAGSMAVETGLMTLHEDELKGIMQMLAQIARTSEGSDQKLDSQPFQ